MGRWARHPVRGTTLAPEAPATHRAPRPGSPARLASHPGIPRRAACPRRVRPRSQPPRRARAWIRTAEHNFTTHPRAGPHNHRPPLATSATPRPQRSRQHRLTICASCPRRTCSSTPTRRPADEPRRRHPPRDYHSATPWPLAAHALPASAGHPRGLSTLSPPADPAHRNRLYGRACVLGAVAVRALARMGLPRPRGHPAAAHRSRPSTRPPAQPSRRQFRGLCVLVCLPPPAALTLAPGCPRACAGGGAAHLGAITRATRTASCCTPNAEAPRRRVLEPSHRPRTTRHPTPRADRTLRVTAPLRVAARAPAEGGPRVSRPTHGQGGVHERHSHRLWPAATTPAAPPAAPCTGGRSRERPPCLLAARTLALPSGGRACAACPRRIDGDRSGDRSAAAPPLPSSHAVFAPQPAGVSPQPKTHAPRGRAGGSAPDPSPGMSPCTRPCAQPRSALQNAAPPLRSRPARSEHPRPATCGPELHACHTTLLSRTAAARPTTRTRTPQRSSRLGRSPADQWRRTFSHRQALRMTNLGGAKAEERHTNIASDI